jgi:hypothetical protein
MISESCRWLLKILNWAKWGNFSTLGFERNWSEIWGDYEYQSRKEFHNLSKECGSSGLWFWTRKLWMIEVDRISEIRFQDWVNFLKFLLVVNFHYMIDFQSLFLDVIRMYDAITTSGPNRPHQKKVVKYRCHTCSRWQSPTHPRG